jgi:hypothetical protein
LPKQKGLGCRAETRHHQNSLDNIVGKETKTASSFSTSLTSQIPLAHEPIILPACLTTASPEEVSAFRIPPGVDAPKEIFVAIIPLDHPVYDVAIAEEPVQTSPFLMSAQQTQLRLPLVFPADPLPFPQWKKVTRRVVSIDRISKVRALVFLSR